MADFTIRQNDTAPIFTYSLVKPDGTVPNLTGATIQFEMREQIVGNRFVSGSAAIVGSPTLGQVSYTWQPTDTNQAGNYNALFLVTFADGTEESFPNDHFLIVQVTKSL